MAEPIGLTLGFAGLAGVFASCVDCFKLVQIYRRRKNDFDFYQTMLDNQQFHFMAWGQACGFMGLDQPELKERFDDPLSRQRNTQIAQTMAAVRSLLTDGQQLKSKYGLKVEKPARQSSDIGTPESTPSAFERVFQGTTRFWNTSLQRKSYIQGTILWTINDKDKFEDLVERLRNLITDLGQFTEGYGVTQSQRLVVKYEMEKIEDEASLEAITEVNSSAPDDDLVSVAASRQLSLVRERSVVGRQGAKGWDLLQPEDSVSMFGKPTMPAIQEMEEDAAIGPQPVEITRVQPSQWRNVKTRQGLFSWLGVLIVCTTTASGPVVASPSGTDATGMAEDDSLAYLRRAITLEDHHLEVTESVMSTGPRKVAINSKTLLAVLGKITGRRLSEAHNVLVHPFKYLMAHEEKIRKVYQSVCEECDTRGVFRAQTSTTGLSQTTSEMGTSVGQEATETLVDTQTDEDLLKDTGRVRDELRCLVEFMDVDLARLLQFRRDLVQGRVSEIAFEHLWLYFEPGYHVKTRVVGDDYSTVQAYGIFHVTGGRLILDGDADFDTASTTFSQLRVPRDTHDDYEFASMTSITMTPFVLDCCYIDTDGRTFGYLPGRFVIPPYRGTRPYDQLPINLCSELDMEKLASRGQKFMSLNDTIGEQFKHFNFTGSSLAEFEPGHNDSCQFCAQSDSFNLINGPVIVDPAAAIQNIKRTPCTFDVKFGQGILAKPRKADPRECFEPFARSTMTERRYTDIFDDSVIDLDRRSKYKYWGAWIQSVRQMRDEPLDSNQLCLLPPRVLAFALGSRKWYPLPLAHLSPIDTSNKTSILDNIILPGGHKELVMALVSSLEESPDDTKKPRTTEATERFAEVSQMQRRCLTVLLHGAPGVGKTMLVEGVALHLNRPLFVVNCAELGSVERGATAKLDTWFNLAKRWRCVLLLKEADVFLAQRGRNDELDRVEIASVLLRLLQTYHGVAFLSTNRVGAFDPGVLSHVNTTLYFPAFDSRNMTNVWKLFIDRAKPDFVVDTAGIFNFAKGYRENGPSSMNGREIRNMWQTAMSLALYQHRQNPLGEKPSLEAEHFRTVEASADQFRRYLTAVSGGVDRRQTLEGPVTLPRMT
ncbi:prion-inhibition and propagation-domain-containing protein [Apodospora peruviana]|uniref:Prion-inhibition and propagation-domain-containing protein n=1 Tax=Apodospora peruviana TaxID=516989 RepID=A0AAE0M551_9PEZI|nr:prion-inhibition and propagation-domain-containing protein [Apodospora peruviana]